MEMKRIFLTRFQHPRFASGYDQNQLIRSDVGWEKKQRVVPKLMIIVPKWDKRDNQRTLIGHSTKIMDTINRMINNKAENSPSGKNMETGDT